MKKKILGIVVMAVVAIAAGWNISQSNDDIKLSDLALDNVEALAWGEGGGGPDWQGFKTVYGPSRTCCQRDAQYKVCSGAHQAC